MTGSRTDQSERPKKPPRPDQRPKDEREDDPWPIENFPKPADDCDCGPSLVKPPAPGRPPRERSKGKDCCEQILEALRCIPGIDEKCLNLRKPKTPPKVKLANLCGALPFKDTTGPILMLIARRHRDGVQAGNQFEKQMQVFLSSQPSKRREALEAALAAYDKIPDARRDCIFDTRFDDWSDDKPLNPEFFGKNVFAEIMALGRYLRYGPGPPPFPEPGKVRPWELEYPAPPPAEPGVMIKRTAPWPWICAINPQGKKATDETGWFRNESARKPGNQPPGWQTYLPHEFSYNCVVAPIPGQPQATFGCKHVEPDGGAGAGDGGGGLGGGGGFGGGFGACPGGADYKVNGPKGKQVCLIIAGIEPGSEVGLRGFNFFSQNARVRIRQVEGTPFDPNPGQRPIPDIPISDLQGDQSADPNTANCGVRDYAYFLMPSWVPQGPNNIPIPPGRYGMTLIVPNEPNYAPVAGQSPPTEFVSNEILFELLPRTNMKFQIKPESGFCYSETDGPGSDEVWFRAMVGKVPLPKAVTDLTLPLPISVDICNEEDVDSGDVVPVTGQPLFADTLGPELLVIGVIGLEVDNEQAAKEQIDDFWDLWGLYMKEFYTALGMLGLGAAVEQAIEKGIFSFAGYAAGAIFLVILIGGLFYAAWAPADLLGYDAMVFSSRQLYELTDHDPFHAPQFHDLAEIGEITIAINPHGKEPLAGGVSIYSESRMYSSPDEGSDYTFRYSFQRI